MANADDNKDGMTPEEIAEEQAALADKKEDEVRAAIIDEFGFDETNDADKIDKLVQKEMDNHKKLSTAIGQKIKHREALKKATQAPPVKPADVKKAEDELEAKLDAKLNERLEQRDLDALEFSDELKAEIKKVAAITGVSIKKAMSDPYISAKIDQVKKDQAAEEASVHRTGGKGGKTKFDINNPPEVNMATEEGRKTYQTWKDAVRDQG